MLNLENLTVFSVCKKIKKINTFCPFSLKKIVNETDFSHGCVLLFGPSLHTQGCTAGSDKLLLNQGDLLRGIVNSSDAVQSVIKGPKQFL